MKKKTFLVTGGAGFIGSHISELLARKNFNVKIYDDNSLGKIHNIKKFKNRIKFIKGDIRNKKLLKKSLKGVDAVVHLAYINGTKHFYNIPITILDIAVKGLTNIIDCCIDNKIKELYLLQRNLKGTFNASWHRNNINHKRIPHAKFKSDIDSLTFSGVSC